jgi:hypothetical protein
MTNVMGCKEAASHLTTHFEGKIEGTYLECGTQQFKALCRHLPNIHSYLVSAR